MHKLQLISNHYFMCIYMYSILFIIFIFQCLHLMIVSIYYNYDFTLLKEEMHKEFSRENKQMYFNNYHYNKFIK